LQITEEASKEYKQTDTEILAAPARIYRQSCQRAWSQIQDSLTRTEQNLKTGKKKYDYTLRVTGS